MPETNGIEVMLELRAFAPTLPVVAMSGGERALDLDLLGSAKLLGAVSILTKPFTKDDLVPAIEMAVSRHTEIRALEAEVAGLTDRLETRKAVERAKGVLQQRLGVSEPEAFRWIQKTAMDLRLSMRQVAEGVITHGPGMAERSASD